MKMKGGAVAVVAVVALLAAAASAHLSRLPGRFSNLHLLNKVADPLV